MKKRCVIFLEAVFKMAIVLVFLHTIAEDILILSRASWITRKIFLVTGFGFDLFFTLGFLIRSWNAITKNSFRQYIIRENGWIDFLASIPLLVFTSGPVIFSLLASPAFLGPGVLMGVSTIPGIVRMARIFRMFRLLNILHWIRLGNSVMVQRHMIRIVTTVVSTLIFSITLIGIVFSLMDDSDIEKAWMMEQRAALFSLEQNPKIIATPEDARVWGESRPSVMLFKEGNRILYARDGADYYKKFFGPEDYSIQQAGPYSVFFDLKASAISQSKFNLTVFLSIVSIVLLIMIGYGPHFVVTISDPVRVMARGLSEKSYSLEVSIPPEYDEDDVFCLGASYNNDFLPLKERQRIEDRSGGVLDISLDDISDLLESK